MTRQVTITALLLCERVDMDLMKGGPAWPITSTVIQLASGDGD